MPVAALKPEEDFLPAHVVRTQPASQALFEFASEKPPIREQELYKHLIRDTLKARQGLSFAKLASRLHMEKTALVRIVSGTHDLSDKLRDQLFEELDIDHVRAKICVVFLRDPDLYDDLTAKMLSEAVKALYCQIDCCRNGIQLEIRPSIVHELMKRGMDMLLEAQEEILRKTDGHLFSTHGD